VPKRSIVFNCFFLPAMLSEWLTMLWFLRLKQRLPTRIAEVIIALPYLMNATQFRNGTQLLQFGTQPERAAGPNRQFRVI